MPDKAASRRRRTSVLLTLVGGALAVVGAVAVAIGLAGQQPEPPSPPAAARSADSDPAGGSSADGNSADGNSSETSSQEATSAQTAELGWSRPERMTIPTIDATSTLENLELDSDGVMTTPQDPGKAGWFTPGPPPGLVGAAVIAGHVTWDQDPAVFFRLGELRGGDRIEVERADGVTAIFEVTRVGQFAKDEFPTKAVYQGVDHAALRLITCGGGYDEQRNRYLDNVIVWAKMVDTEQT